MTVLALLVSRNLLHHEGGRLALHQTLSDDARQLLPEGVIERHRRYYLERINAAREDWRTIETDYQQVLQAWAWALPEAELGTTLDLIDALHVFQVQHGQWQDALTWMVRGIELAVEIPDHHALLSAKTNRQR